MKIEHSGRQSRFPLVIAVIVVMILSIALKAPLHAGFWDQINEKLLLMRLIGGGDFIGYERNVDTKDPLFPLEVVNDGFKMIRAYQDFPDSYLVEWTWRALVKNKSPRSVEITFEYKLHDRDAFLVAASRQSSKKIAAGETMLIEKVDHLSYEKANRVMNSSWYIHLQN
jgi:hypothetical protein